MVSIKKQIVPANIGNKVIYGHNNGKKTVTVHQTGNTSKGADAQVHANLQSKGNSRAASWHYSVDDKHAIQSFEDSAQCWHAGDGRGQGNLNSISIEICINSDGDYKKAVKNGAELVKHLLDKYGLSINDVKQHYNWSGKNCPAQIRAGKEGISWADFVKMVEGFMSGTTTVKTDKPKTGSQTVTKDNLVVDGYWGRETTKALQRHFSTPIDGEIWGQVSNQATLAITGGVKYGTGGSPMIKKLQSNVGSKADGYLGANTVRSMQRYLKTPADGIISQPSTMVKELQRRLNAGTF